MSMPAIGHWRRDLPLVAILLLAAGLRFWHLDSLPPGLYHDEAYDGLDALALLQGQSFPIYHEAWELYADEAHADRAPEYTRFPLFLEGNYGREPLQAYLIALSIAVFGPSPWAVRFVSAAAGVLGVLTTFAAAFTLFDRQTERGIPLLAALALAVFYSAITFSRFGIRAMLLVPVETATVACFWLGVRRGCSAGDSEPAGRKGWSGWRWFAAAGFLLGSSQYTYSASRLLPLLFVFYVPYWFLRDGPGFARYKGSVGLMALVSLVTAGPLLIFFARYPFFFAFRTGFVANKGLGAVPGKPWLTWLGNVGRLVRGFFWEGDINLRHNLPGRPYLDPAQGLLLLVGLAPMRRRSGEPVDRRPLFVLLWLFVMLLPTILSGDAPHFGRMIGAAPVVAILVACGVSRLWRLASEGRWRWLVAGALALLLLGSAVLSVRDYFWRYAQQPDLPAAFQVDDWKLGQYAASQAAEASVYLTPTQEEMATIYFALQGDTDQFRSYYGPAGVIPLGRPNEPAVYLVRPDDGASLARLAAHFPTGAAGEHQNQFTAFHVPAGASRGRTDFPCETDLGGPFVLRGWSADSAGVELAVTLYWEARQAPALDYTAYVHVTDPSGVLVAQLDRQPVGYPTSDWRRGEMVMDRYLISLPDGVAPGEVMVHTGFYYLPTMEPVGERVALGTVALWGE